MFIVFCPQTVFCCVCVCVIREEPVSLNNSLKMFGHEGGSTCVFISNATLTSFLCLQTRFYTQPAHLPACSFKQVPRTYTTRTKQYRQDGTCQGETQKKQQPGIRGHLCWKLSDILGWTV